MLENIIIKGAREHNLKNIAVEIPKNQLVVFTGVSGSGKSSLAFDTIYAEGQRRYVESLSSYARQFLGVMAKPEVDFIEGLSPSISIDQKSVGHNPRSTVGTITEIYDYLRLLYARIGHPFCPICGQEISKLSIDEIMVKIQTLIKSILKTNSLKPQKFTLLAPLIKERKGEFTSLFQNLKAKGYTKAIIDQKLYSLDEEIILIKTNKHTILVVIDAFSLTHNQWRDVVFQANFKSRLFAGVEQTLNLSDGQVVLAHDDKPHLFSEKFSCPNCNLSLPEIEPRMFSFNSPLGACVKCKGLGFLTRIDPDLILNENLSINEGGIIPFGMVFYHLTWFARLLQSFLDDVRINPSAPIKKLTDSQRRLLLYGNNKIYKVKGLNRFGKETAIFEKFIGVIPELERRHAESASEFARFEIEKYMNEEICPECRGARLKPEVLGIKINQKNIYEVGQLAISNALNFFHNLPVSLYEKEIARAITNEIINRLQFLSNVGLSYLTINRPAASLSGGESQRIRLASQIGSGLTGVIYVLDEPSIGLHPKDVSALIDNLKKLRDLGNTLIIVEHDQETIEAADWIIDFGPYAGKNGGKVVFTGSLRDLRKDKTSLTGRYLSHQAKMLPGPPAKKNGLLSIDGCSQYNLKKINARFPLGNLIGVTGVSGSGKSTLVVETLYLALSYYLHGRHKHPPGPFSRLEGYQYLDGVYLVDQSAIGRTSRSNPATYVGVFDHIRDVFAQTADARVKGYKKGRFSFNVKGGRCEKCAGAGSLKIEMQFLPDVYMTCDICSGRRYNSETLEVKYKDKSIDQILRFTVDEALDFFKSHPLIFHKLRTLNEVGLGYLELGQPAPTLSGGEAQRIKLAYELAKKETGRTLYILDEPTTGLHPYDIEKLLQTLYKLVGKGNTVVIIEHNLEVIRHCQYVIDLGPEAGEAGGEIVYQGPLAGLTSVSRSHTGRYLKAKKKP